MKIEDVVRNAFGMPLTSPSYPSVADLPVLEVKSAVRILSGLTLGLGEVVHDYLAK